MKIKKIAQAILDDLIALHNRTRPVQHMAHSYKDKQLEIITNRLKELMEDLK